MVEDAAASLALPASQKETQGESSVPLVLG